MKNKIKRNFLRLSILAFTFLLFISGVRAEEEQQLTIDIRNYRKLVSDALTNPESEIDSNPFMRNIKNNPKLVQIKKGEDIKIDEEYSFALGINGGTAGKADGAVEIPEYVSGAWSSFVSLDADGKETNYWSNAGMAISQNTWATEAAKGKFNVVYKGVDVYKGQLIDVKVTVDNFETMENANTSYLNVQKCAKDELEGNGECKKFTKYSEEGYPNVSVIGFSKSAMGVNVVGIKWVTLKYEFYKSGTTDKVDIKGNTTYWDVDGLQGIYRNNHQGKIYIDMNEDHYVGDPKEEYKTGKTKYQLKATEDLKYIYEPMRSETHTATNQQRNTVDEKHDTTIFPGYAFTEIFDIPASGNDSSLLRTYTFGDPASIEGNSWKTVGLGGIWNSSIPVIPSELKIDKEVNKEVVRLGEKFQYTIKLDIPMMASAYYYQSLIVTDSLPEPLYVGEPKDIKVLDADNGKDVTSKFFSNITTEGQKINIPVDGLDNFDFYGHTYNIVIPTYIKSDADLSKFKEGDKYVIRNKAEVTFLNKGAGETTTPTTIGTKEVVVIYSPEIAKVPDTGANISKIGIALGFMLIIGSVGVIIYTSKKNKKAFK